jgi:hypothetical protein
MQAADTSAAKAGIALVVIRKTNSSRRGKNPRELPCSAIQRNLGIFYPPQG